jgi:4-hydroxybenzoyl-CoA thioesterase
MAAYETVIPVRFGHVDYAGIMYYPRFFDNFHAVFEDMFGDRLGVSYMAILKDRRIGFPMVKIETEFRKPFRFGEPMRLRLTCTRVGRSSIDFHYRGFNGAETEPSVEARSTVVTVNLDTLVAIETPPDIRAVLRDLHET